MREQLSLNDKVMNAEYKICRHCGVEKERIPSGRYPNIKDTIYLNKDGKQWNGLMCPDCHRDVIRVNQKIRLDKRKAQREIINAKRRERYKLTGK